jgi:hypothetical protein
MVGPLIAAPCPLRGFVAALALLAAVPVPCALADALQQRNFGAWNRADECARQAQLKFPDFTKLSNAQREAWRQQCLRNNRLPVVSAPPVPPSQ